MRLPIASPLVSRDGSANKDARLTNMLKESDGSRELAVTRPGLSLVATGSGVGGGLVAFNGELISVYGTTLGVIPPPTNWQWSIAPDELYGADASYVIYVSGAFYMLDASGNIYSSTDGNYWSRTASALTVFGNSSLPYGDAIAGNGKTLCAIGGQYSNMAYVSNDGGKTWGEYTAITWMPTTPIPGGSIPIGLDGVSITHDGTCFVGCFIDTDGTATMGRSLDGKAWTQTGDRPAWQTNRVSQFCSDGSVILACNFGNGAAYSIDHGLTWNDSELQPSEDPLLCAYGNGVFVAVAEDLGGPVNVYVSTDGIDFNGGVAVTTITCNAPGARLSFNGSVFVYTGYGGAFAISADGRTWTNYIDSSGATWLYVASGNNISVSGSTTGIWQIARMGLPVDNIASLNSIATGIYDFAQGPL